MARTTAERLEKLLTIRDQIEDRIAEITLHPKPTYTVDGQTLEWNDYLKRLQESLAATVAAAKALDTSGALTITQVYTG